MWTSSGPSCGPISSTTVGLYPLTPATANLGVSTPTFPLVTVRPTRGVVTRIERSGNGAHVKDLVVDGVSRQDSWLAFGPGVRPGRVVVVTTDDPDPAWGTHPGDLPPS